MKAHPALFEGEGRGEPKNEALLFQSISDNHIQNARNYSSLQLTYTFKTLEKTANARTLCVYCLDTRIFIIPNC